MLEHIRCAARSFDGRQGRVHEPRISAAEAVYRLLLIADPDAFPGRLSQSQEQGQLDRVRILEFVNQHQVKLPGHAAENLLHVQGLQGQNFLINKIDRTPAGLVRPIGFKRPRSNAEIQADHALAIVPQARVNVVPSGSEPNPFRLVPPLLRGRERVDQFHPALPRQRTDRAHLAGQFQCVLGLLNAVRLDAGYEFAQRLLKFPVKDFPIPGRPGHEAHELLDAPLRAGVQAACRQAVRPGPGHDRLHRGLPAAAIPVNGETLLQLGQLCRFIDRDNLGHGIANGGIGGVFIKRLQARGEPKFEGKVRNQPAAHGIYRAYPGGGKAMCLARPAVLQQPPPNTREQLVSRLDRKRGCQDRLRPGCAGYDVFVKLLGQAMSFARARAGGNDPDRLHAWASGKSMPHRPA